MSDAAEMIALTAAIVAALTAGAGRVGRVGRVGRPMILTSGLFFFLGFGQMWLWLSYAAWKALASLYRLTKSNLHHLLQPAYRALDGSKSYDQRISVLSDRYQRNRPSPECDS